MAAGDCSKDEATGSCTMEECRGGGCKTLGLIIRVATGWRDWTATLTLPGAMASRGLPLDRDGVRDRLEGGGKGTGMA